MSDLELTEQGESIDLFQLITPGGPLEYGVAGGMSYLSLNLHPAGAMAGMQRALEADVEWVPISAVEALVPASWLASECMGDGTRLQIIDGLLAHIQKAHR